MNNHFKGVKTMNKIVITLLLTIAISPGLKALNLKPEELKEVLKKPTALKKPIDKQAQAETIANKISDETIASLATTLNYMASKGVSFDDADYKALMINMGALNSPTPKMTGVRFTTKSASDLYSTVKKAFYSIKSTPDLLPGEGLGIGVALLHKIKGMIESHHISTMHEIAKKPELLKKNAK